MVISNRSVFYDDVSNEKCHTPIEFSAKVSGYGFERVEFVPESLIRTSKKCKRKSLLVTLSATVPCNYYNFNLSAYKASLVFFFKKLATRANGLQSVRVVRE